MRRRDDLVARLVALAWTALWFGGFTVSIWRASSRTWDSDPLPAERVRMTQLAPPVPSSAPPLPDEGRVPAPPPAPAATRAPAAPVPPGAMPPRDSARSGASAGAGAVVPGAVGAAPATGDACTGPCAERGGAAPPGSDPLGTQAERDAALWGYVRGSLAEAIRRGPPAPTGAERDSILRDRAARGEAADAAGRGSSPTVGGGVTLGVGLPGGGPSAAERARNRVLDAEVRARLERIRSRADSVRWARCDSLARRDPAAAARDTLCTTAPR